MIANLETLRETLKTLAIRDENSKNDFFLNNYADHSVPDSFPQMFSYVFSEENINETIKQLRNENATINSEITSNKNDGVIARSKSWKKNG
ncbi:1785_t:CDS:2 [Gigaspora margarita]|uniref:1785_t:CDS:1 n=1 Tax=Gigaspora margarita TaxID=4874 RepID=A0ABM8W2Z4_GIGMA|nr:1785_t:CDS:2 [Gigaspora margarita]